MYNYSAMFALGRPSKRLTVLVLLCTLGIFLIAAPTGPYSAVHGPVTALRALRAAIAIFWLLAAAALALVGPLFFSRMAFSVFSFSVFPNMAGRARREPLFRLCAGSNFGQGSGPQLRC